MTKVYEIEGTIDERYVDVEDGGRAMIYQLDETMGMESGGDKNFFVRLQSWDENGVSQRGEPKPKPGSHPLFQSLVGKRVRVTVEVIGD